MNIDSYLKKVAGSTFARIATKSVSFGTLIQKRANIYLNSTGVVTGKQIAGII
jgi:hypothetical protein